MLNQCPLVQKLRHQSPQSLLAVLQPVIAIREKIHLYFFKGAASGKFRDVFPAKRIEIPSKEAVAVSPHSFEGYHFLQSSIHVGQFEAREETDSVIQ
jgi:hypothetical protein